MFRNASFNRIMTEAFFLLFEEQQLTLPTDIRKYKKPQLSEHVCIYIKDISLWKITSEG